jgi:hypothetical protein
MMIHTCCSRTLKFMWLLSPISRKQNGTPSSSWTSLLRCEIDLSQGQSLELFWTLFNSMDSWFIKRAVTAFKRDYFTILLVICTGHFRTSTIHRDKFSGGCNGQKESNLSCDGCFFPFTECPPIHFNRTSAHFLPDPVPKLIVWIYFRTIQTFPCLWVAGLPDGGEFKCFANGRAPDNLTINVFYCQSSCKLQMSKENAIYL